MRRLNGIQEVGGSIPIGSTKIPNNINDLTVNARRGNFEEKVIKSYKEKRAAFSASLSPIASRVSARGLIRSP